MGRFIAPAAVFCLFLSRCLPADACGRHCRSRTCYEACNRQEQFCVTKYDSADPNLIVTSCGCYPTLDEAKKAAKECGCSEYRVCTFDRRCCRWVCYYCG